MKPTKARIAENDIVELTVQVGKWPAGTRGAAAIDHGDAKLVEISDDWGQELDLFDVPNEKLKLIAQAPRLPPGVDPDF